MDCVVVILIVSISLSMRALRAPTRVNLSLGNNNDGLLIKNQIEILLGFGLWDFGLKEED